MGAVQRLATIVIIGLVALSTILVLYLADESNRLEAEEEEQREVAIQRGIGLYVQNCLQCHGPAGQGFMAPGEQGTGRIGAPLGGDTFATRLNQEGINAQGTPVSGGVERRAEILRDTITNGRPPNMPAWGNELNAEQIDQLVTMIQYVDWDEVFNEAVAVSGGYPTPPPAAAAASEPTQAPAAAQEGGDGAAGQTARVVSVDIAFEPSELTIPADTDVVVELPNEGAAAHNFSIDALGISVDLAPGETKSATINAPAGTYEYYCNVPGHREAGMVGTLTVE